MGSPFPWFASSKSYGYHLKKGNSLSGVNYRAFPCFETTIVASSKSEGNSI